MTNEQLNHLFTADFDRYLMPKYIKPMLHYNKNDVFLVCEIARQKPDEIKLRYSLGHALNLIFYVVLEVILLINFLISSILNVVDLKKLLLKIFVLKELLYHLNVLYFLILNLRLNNFKTYLKK